MWELIEMWELNEGLREGRKGDSENNAYGGWKETRDGRDATRDEKDALGLIRIRGGEEKH
jgi:hypothetical protein